MNFEDLRKAIENGEMDESLKVTESMLARGLSPKEIINDGIAPAMEAIGEKYDRGEVFIPELLISADAAQAVLGKLEPLLGDEGRKEKKIALFATVKGDQHDIGKNIACMVFRGAGYEVIDLGADVSPEEIVRSVKEMDVDIVGLSALLTTTMKEMKNTIKALEDAGLRDKVKVVVGGAPVTEDFAKEIGADMYGESPFEVVKKLKNKI